MRILLVVATIAATIAVAHAAPWQYQTYYSEEGDIQFFNAAQWTDGAEPFGIGYECDDFSFEDGLYIQTPERFDPRTSYAPEVPTIFTVDGKAIEVSGEFQNSNDTLYVYFSGPEIETFQDLFNALAAARSDIQVAYFDKSLSFSSEGVEEALLRVVRECLG